MSYRINNYFSQIICAALSTLLIFNLATPVRACGPSFIEPIFVFTESADLPFNEFTKGNIGIIKPTFGRKTLTIAFRYLNGGSFSTDEQKALATAMRGKATTDPAIDPLKVWITTRKEFLAENETLPEIYVDKHRYTGFDFFPNCTPNAFEVATETLKARVASYGARDKDVRAWLAAQDIVFKNCAAGGFIPERLGADSVQWLRKDRDYQIAAAHFYSLNFETARRLFGAIAADTESPWQETADYLVGRTWVREASLNDNENQREELYRQAELYLQALQVRATTFARATQRLTGLVNYRIHPEQRLRELARALAYQNGNDNLGQDLIDYVWLVDKFETKELKAIEERKNPPPEPVVESEREKYFRERREAMSAGELFEIVIYPKIKDGTYDYSERLALDFKKGVTEAGVIQQFEVETGRKLTDDELKQIKERYAYAVSDLRYAVSPNRKFDSHPINEYEGCSYDCQKLPLKGFPDFLRADDLTDWILTLQTDDATAYSHALRKWRDTKSEAWLALLLVKAQKTSPRLSQLMRRAERVERDSPAFATIAYHLVRLKLALGQQTQARAMLDDIISWQSDVLPISAQNQFLEQRLKLSKTLDEFLRFSARRPVAFYNDGSYGTIRDFVAEAKSYWDPQNMQETKEEYERQIDKSYESLLPWDNQPNFDNDTVDLINWHFPAALMEEISQRATLTEQLRRRFALAAWTRAIVLKQPALAEKITPELMKLAPEISTLLQAYLDAKTPQERKFAALYVLLKFPGLSPTLEFGVPSFNAVDANDYYLEIAWWCPPSNTEFNSRGEEVAKVVPKPAFLTQAQIEAARHEREALAKIGTGKSYLGKQAIAWANATPEDPRLPEALYIAVQANVQYKYGCSSWESDEATMHQAETILRTKYPQSPWTAKLNSQQ